MIARSIAAFTVVFGLGVIAHSQPRVPDIRPRVGQISDEVALQRLRAAGVDNPRVLRREGTDILVQGSFQGRETTLRLDGLQGTLVDTAAPAKELLGLGATIDRPQVTGPQLVAPRAALSDPALMREAVRPQP